MRGDLNNWSGLIERQADERRQRDEEDLAELFRRYPEQVERLKTLTHAELVDHFRWFAQRGCADPRQTKVYQDLADEARAEILRRLSK